MLVLDGVVLHFWLAIIMTSSSFKPHLFRQHASFPNTVHWAVQTKSSNNLEPSPSPRLGKPSGVDRLSLYVDLPREPINQSLSLSRQYEQHQLSKAEGTIASCIRQLGQGFCKMKPPCKSFDSLCAWLD